MQFDKLNNIMERNTHDINLNFLDIFQYDPFDIFVSTLTKDGRSLHDLLIALKSKFPDKFYFVAVQTDSSEQVKGAIKYLKMPITNSIPCRLYYLPKEKAMKFDTR